MLSVSQSLFFNLIIFEYFRLETYTCRFDYVYNIFRYRLLIYVFRITSVSTKDLLKELSHGNITLTLKET